MTGKKVLRTDESKFEPFASNGRVYVRTYTGEHLKVPHVTPTIKHGRGRALVWGYFASDRAGDFEMKKEQYYSNLQHHAVPSGPTCGLKVCSAAR